MKILKRNTFAGGTPDTALTSTNTAGISGDAMTTPSVNNGATIAFFDDGLAPMGGKWARVTAASGATAYSPLAGLANNGRTTASVFVRFGQISTVTQNLLYFRTASSNVAALNLTAGGGLNITNSAGAVIASSVSPTGLIDADTIYRIDFAVQADTATTGSTSYAIYLGDSATPLYSTGEITGQNLGTVTTIAECRIGRSAGSTQAIVTDYANLVIAQKASGFLDPAAMLPPLTGLYRMFRVHDLELANGALLQSWPATVGGATIAQATASWKPSVATNVLGGKTVGRWPNASNSFFVMGSSQGTQAQPVTVVAIVKPGSTIGTQQIQVLNWGIELHTEAGGWKMYAGAGGILSASDTLTTSWAVLIATYNGATSSLYLNGQLIASGNVGSNATGTSMYVGRHSSNSRQWRGDIAEVSAYSVVLDATGRQRIADYAAAFYGLTADSAPAVEIVAPTAGSTVRVAASDDVGVISVSVTLPGSGTFPASFDAESGLWICALTGLAEDTYFDVFATATDTGGRTTQSAPVTFNVYGTTLAFTGSAGFSGSGALTGSASPSTARAAAFGGSGTLATTATPAASRAVSLSGSGTLTASPKPATTAVAGFGGTGSLSAAASPSTTAAASLSGNGVLTVSSRPSAGVTPTLSGSGSLSTGAQPASQSAPSLTGSGSLSAAGTPGARAAAAFTGSGALTAAASPGAATPASLTGSGTFSAAASSDAASTAALFGAGTLAAAAASDAASTVALSGAGSLTVTADPHARQQVTLSGDGTLSVSAAPSENPTGAAGFSGTGTLAASAGPKVSRAVTLSGSGTLRASGVPSARRTPSFSGSGSLGVAGDPSIARPIAYTGSGMLAGGSAISLARAVDLTGSGELVLDRAVHVRVAAVFAGSGMLTAARIREFRDIDFTVVAYPNPLRVRARPNPVTVTAVGNPLAVRARGNPLTVVAAGNPMRVKARRS